MMSEKTKSAKVEDGAANSVDSATEETKELSAEEALAQAEEKYLRLAAEFENFKKRSLRERGDLIQSANDQLIIQILDVVDNFERALNQTQQSASGDSIDKDKLFDSLHQGAQMIHGQLKTMLTAHGVVEIEAEGVPFDPETHEAVLQIESDTCPPDHVAQVLTKGYKKGDRVLRHVKVGVAKAGVPKDEKTESEKNEK